MTFWHHKCFLKFVGVCDCYICILISNNEQSICHTTLILLLMKLLMTEPASTEKMTEADIEDSIWLLLLWLLATLGVTTQHGNLPNNHHWQALLSFLMWSYLRKDSVIPAHCRLLNKVWCAIIVTDTCSLLATQGASPASQQEADCSHSPSVFHNNNG